MQHLGRPQTRPKIAKLAVVFEALKKGKIKMATQDSYVNMDDAIRMLEAGLIRINRSDIQPMPEEDFETIGVYRK